MGYNNNINIQAASLFSIDRIAVAVMIYIELYAGTSVKNHSLFLLATYIIVLTSCIAVHYLDQLFKEKETETSNDEERKLIKQMEHEKYELIEKMNLERQIWENEKKELIEKLENQLNVRQAYMKQNYGMMVYIGSLEKKCTYLVKQSEENSLKFDEEKGKLVKSLEEMNLERQIWKNEQKERTEKLEKQLINMRQVYMNQNYRMMVYVGSLEKRCTDLVKQIEENSLKFDEEKGKLVKSLEEMNLERQIWENEKKELTEKLEKQLINMRQAYMNQNYRMMVYVGSLEKRCTDLVKQSEENSLKFDEETGKLVKSLEEMNLERQIWMNEKKELTEKLEKQLINMRQAYMNQNYRMMVYVGSLEKRCTELVKSLVEKITYQQFLESEKSNLLFDLNNQTFLVQEYKKRFDQQECLIDSLRTNLQLLWLHTNHEGEIRSCGCESICRCNSPYPDSISRDGILDATSMEPNFYRLQWL